MSSDEEDFAHYGTPLDPIEEDEVVRKKPRTVEDQIAKDKYGRRRFHGAFTGGFSAGYFNSVGSLDGWTPSTFKSSRTCKAENQTQNPEDFMDDEDTDEFGIAPKVLRLKGDYDNVEEKLAKKRSRLFTPDGSIPGRPILQILVEPLRSSVGVKLLKRMGWKIGQGVGPRLSKREKKEQRLRMKTSDIKVYGCSRPDVNVVPQNRSAETDESSDGDDDDDITFAPDDYDPYIVKAKDNLFGIGYSGLDRRRILSSHINLFEPSFSVKEKSKKFSIKGQGFGVGALEEEDEDIYSHDDMSQYDFSLESKPSSSKKPDKIPLAITQSNAPLLGFVVACDVVRKKYFPPPKIPLGFQPVHSVRKSRFEPAQGAGESKTKKQGLHRHDLTAEERAVLLDEPLPRVSITTCEPSEKYSTELSSSSVDDCNNQIGNVAIKSEPPSNNSVEGLGSVFKPFVSNVDKQKRYEQFLKLVKIGQKEKLSSLQPLSMTEWERERERVEFEQAEKLYRPISAVFSDRFVSASQPDDATNALIEVQRTPDDQNDMKEAAKKKMFGKLTRKVYTWTPSSLLCKRFNIREPDSGKGFDGRQIEKKRPKFSVFNFLEAATSNSSITKDNLSENIQTTNTGSNSSRSEVEDLKFVKTESSMADSTPNVIIEISNDNKESNENLATNEINVDKQNAPNLAVAKRKQTTAAKLNSIDDAVYTWYKQQLSVGVPVRGVELQGAPEKFIERLRIQFLDDANKEDLYKAIFLSSSDESEDEPESNSEKHNERTVESQISSNHENEDENKLISSNGTRNEPNASVINVLRNTSPPRGIFANIDLDLINSRKSNRPDLISNSSDMSNVSVSNKVDCDSLKTCEESVSCNEKGKSDADLFLYGPALPSISSGCKLIKPKHEVIDLSNSDSSESVDEWIESDKISSKKHKSKKKKHKTHKEHKHKHKKHKKHKH